jgi:hypothetical protein
MFRFFVRFGSLTSPAFVDVVLGERKRSGAVLSFLFSLHLCCLLPADCSLASRYLARCLHAAQVSPEGTRSTTGRLLDFKKGAAPFVFRFVSSGLVAQSVSLSPTRAESHFVCADRELDFCQPLLSVLTRACGVCPNAGAFHTAKAVGLPMTPIMVF